MKKNLFLSIIVLLVAHASLAQLSRFIVTFKHKGATTFTLANPSAFLSQRAIDRRTRYGIAIDSTDMPVPVAYINQVKSITGVTFLNASRWLNAITVDTTDPGAYAAITALPFVQSISSIAARMPNTGVGKWNNVNVIPVSTSNRETGTAADYFDYGTASYNEIHLQKGEFLHNIGLRGQGMQISILDAGFFNYTTLDAMDSIVANGQVLSTWDFVNKEASVVEDHSHGMQCLSTIAANIPGQFIGKAPKASFHLFKTEDVASEYPIEEFNWVCGAERADSSGTDILTSSVAYNTFDNAALNHTYADMDGNTTIVTRGADLAARKGIMVFNSVGNDGNGSWHYLLAPSDGDSVVAVGAVNSAGAVWPGSSYGPSSDGRIKPDIASVGWIALIQGTGNFVGTGTGTSFACPNMAGLATCLWQGFPEVNNMRIVRALKEAGSIAATPNDRIGYGIPDMKLAFGTLLTQYATSTASLNSCTVTLSWNSKDVGAMKYEIQRKAPGDADYIKIGEVTPLAGTTLANRSYQFTNNLANVGAGNLSYRIRQVIDTAAASFTAVLIDTADVTLTTACTTTATNDPNANENKIWISPNPAQNETSLVIRSENAVPKLSVRIYDMSGRLVAELHRSISSGQTTITLPVNPMAKGKYVVNVYDKATLIGSADLLKL
ncbi:MAG: S8 family peptidase [Chitinophagaceae bacterium]|nr:S8 family peptidase [Chitinophagaceae bacterium]